MKLHNLDIYNHVSVKDMLDKLDEEVVEVRWALVDNDMDNIKEELMDVIQCCYGIAYTKGINLEDCVEAHNKKLESRLHKFID
ncbi:MazG nucleotide pyrophosphohydrolase domain-containing protein [Clostridium sp.]|uniref:MazG nucleotide pyrophosphohydrolase domain-containing protein n=1 Tax=Clostridium sp. TaxID=1506 RepID=UPI003F2CF26A